MLATVMPSLGTMPAARRAHLRGDLTALRRAVAPSPLFIALVVTAIGSAAALVIDSGFNHLKPLVIAFVASSWMISLYKHEFGHAAAAFLAGDRSGRARGYLTLDLRRYTNPLLSIALPALMLPAGRVPLPGGLVFVDDSAIRTPSARNASSASPVLL